MQTLSIKQPWATLVVHGLKTIEIRRWSTRVRGSILIHTGLIADDRPQGWAHLPSQLADQAKLRGGIIGVVDLTDCLTYPNPDAFRLDCPRHRNDADWFLPPRLFGFTMKSARVLPFHECSGWVRFFQADHPLLRTVTNLMEMKKVENEPRP